MCQLTFIDLGSKNLNKIAATAIGLVNSSGVNNDGVGLFQMLENKNEYFLFKSEIAPINMENWGNIVAQTITRNSPVLMHVRNATAFGAKKVRIISDEKSHPFLKNRFVIAHNGTIEFRDKDNIKPYENSDMIDSEIFAEELEKAYTGDKPFVDALKETADKFEGKFAFLIYNFSEQRFYIVRGITKTLYKVQIKEELEDGSEKVLGIIVNTEREDLLKGLKHFIQLSNTVYDRKIFHTEPELLQGSSVFAYDKREIVRVSDITEHSPYVFPAVNKTTVNNKNQENYRWQNRFDDNDDFDDDVIPLPSGKPTYPTIIIKGEEDEDESEVEKQLIVYMDRLGLDYSELDKICDFAFGTTIINISKSEMLFLVNKVLPTLGESNVPVKYNYWKAITKKYIGKNSSIYEKYNLNFPYMFNDTIVLQNLSNKLLAGVM